MTTTKTRTATLKWADIEVGDEVTPHEIPVTTTMIVAGAIASRDFMPVHHDRDYANGRHFASMDRTPGQCGRSRIASFEGRRSDIDWNYSVKLPHQVDGHRYKRLKAGSNRQGRSR